MAVMNCNFLSFIFLLYLAAMIPYLHGSADNVKLDAFTEKRAQQALEESIRSYVADPEDVTFDFNEQVGE